jgi:hypothetical protein
LALALNLEIISISNRTSAPVYEPEKEASIKDVIETVDNPFDI